uniref:ELYS-like domain-containing protein n=1 Tax=Opuntia streptacantha TaxID=393608 RepID=A0A7C9AK89_OPUST
MFLRWSGRDFKADLMSLSEAVTAVRVRVECALLTEAFMYQRKLCSKVKEKQLKHQLPVDASDDLESEVRSWTDWVLVLVTEICSLCIRRNWVDRLIELPWNSDEERHLHKCLLDYATADPCKTPGSLLVVYYLQRHRYIDAYHIDCKLRALEEDFLSKNNVDEAVFYRMNSVAHWRSGLVNKSVELLPEVEQQQLKTGGLPEDTVLCRNQVDLRRAETPGQQDQATAVSSTSSSLHSSILFPTEHGTPLRSSSFGISKTDGNAGDIQSDFINLASHSLSHSKFFTPSERLPRSPFNAAPNFKLDDMLTPGIRSMRAHTIKDVGRAPSRLFQGDLQDTQLDEVPLPVEQNGVYGQFPKVSPPNSRRVMAKPATTPIRSRGLLDDSPQDRYKTAYGKRLSPGEDSDRPRSTVISADAMDISRR